MKKPPVNKVPPNAPSAAPAAEPDGLWRQAQEMLRQMVHPDLFRMWFGPIRAVSCEADLLTLGVANDYFMHWLQDNYSALIRDVLAQITGRAMDIRFVVRADAAKLVVAELSLPEAPEPAPFPAHAPSIPAVVGRELCFNPKNTFESFVVGDGNNEAHAAALAVAQTPGRSYNPLFFHGGVGLGKTHLLQAVGQHIATHRKTSKVVYVTTEKFTNEYIESIQNNQIGRFRKRYRQMDVLLIDDIQFLAGKERIQEEFFHTFNALYENHKQIVIAGDRPVSEIQNLEQRLVSRFEWGLTAEIRQPDYETRFAIIRKKAVLMNFNIPDEVFGFLANRIRSNIRRLEGALVRVGFYADLVKRQLSVDDVQKLLSQTLQEEGKLSISIELIQKRVVEHYDLRLTDMHSKRRPEHIAFPRQIAMYLSRQLTECSLSSIGDAFGGRDHGTVLHACRHVKDRMETESSVREVVTYLERQLLR